MISNTWLTNCSSSQLGIPSLISLLLSLFIFAFKERSHLITSAQNSSVSLQWIKICSRDSFSFSQKEHTGEDTTPILFKKALVARYLFNTEFKLKFTRLCVRGDTMREAIVFWPIPTRSHFLAFLYQFLTSPAVLLWTIRHHGHKYLYQLSSTFEQKPIVKI